MTAIALGGSGGTAQDGTTMNVPPGATAIAGTTPATRTVRDSSPTPIWFPAPAAPSSDRAAGEVSTGTDPRPAGRARTAAGNVCPGVPASNAPYRAGLTITTGTV